MEILLADDYTGPIQTHTFTNVVFAYDSYDTYNWVIPMGLKENKVINITNKQFSFQPLEMKTHDTNYMEKAVCLYQQIQDSSDFVSIDEPVYLFFDYETTTSTSHSVDFLTHALYFYFQKNHSPAKLLIPATAHETCISFLELLKRWFPISYCVLQPKIVYRFKHFSCVRSYLNVHLREVKEFFVHNLLKPIVTSCNMLPAPKVVMRIKQDHGLLQTSSTVFSSTEIFSSFCKDYSIYDLQSCPSEELKIYYLNQAETIFVSWGSIYYIYINYCLISAETKKISVLFHKNSMNERQFLLANQNHIYSEGPGIYHQCIAYNCGSMTDQLYNLYSFQGEVIQNIECLDEVCGKTRLLDNFKKKEKE